MKSPLSAVVTAETNFTLEAADALPFLQHSRNPLLSRLWERIEGFAQEDAGVLSLRAAEHAARVRRGRYAYLGEATALRLEATRACDLDFIPEHLKDVGYGIALQKNSVYRDAFTAQ